MNDVNMTTKKKEKKMNWLKSPVTARISLDARSLNFLLRNNLVGK